MKLAAGMRLKVGEYVLNKNIKHVNHIIKSCNINNAKSIGILFNATDSVSFEVVRNFVKDISDKAKTVVVLGFVDSKQLIDHYLYRKGFEFFTRNELNWYGKPESEAVNNFIKQEFDILINLNLEDNYPIKYILSLSKASFKVGRLTEAHQFHDLMIDIEHEKEAMKDIQSELMKDEKQAKAHHTSYDQIADIRTSVELQTSYLINHLVHYLSILK
jgi:hypothetical protein